MMKKRKWCYINHPGAYDIACNKCGGSNLHWSEWEHMIWCYDCEEDVPGTGGIFDGPIPMGIAGLMGFSFNRFYLASPDKMFKPVHSGNYLVYRQCSKADRDQFEPVET